MTRSQNFNRWSDMPGWKIQDAERRSSTEQRAHVHVALLFVRELEQLRREEAVSSGDDGIRKHIHPDVVQIDLIVVQLAAVGDGLFERDDPALQLLEGFVGLELRIVLGD